MDAPFSDDSPGLLLYHEIGHTFQDVLSRMRKLGDNQTPRIEWQYIYEPDIVRPSWRSFTLENTISQWENTRQIVLTITVCDQVKRVLVFFEYWIQ